MMLVSSLSNICNVFSFIFLAPLNMFTLFLHRKNIKVYYCCRWHARAKERVTQALKIERENEYHERKRDRMRMPEKVR